MKLGSIPGPRLNNFVRETGPAIYKTTPALFNYEVRRGKTLVEGSLIDVDVGHFHVCSCVSRREVGQERVRPTDTFSSVGGYSKN